MSVVGYALLAVGGVTVLVMLASILVAMERIPQPERGRWVRVEMAAGGVGAGLVTVGWWLLRGW